MTTRQAILPCPHGSFIVGQVHNQSTERCEGATVIELPFDPNDADAERRYVDGAIMLRLGNLILHDHRLDPASVIDPDKLALLAAGMALTSAGQGPPALKSAIAKLSRVVAPEAEGGLVVDLKEPGFVDLLRTAVGSATVVSLTYTAVGSGRTTQRQVEPWSVFSANGNWYLSAFCRTADAERVFRVDRIREAESTDETFTPPDTPPPPEVRYTPGEEDVRTTIRLGGTEEVTCP